MDKVVLYYEERPDINISMEIYFTDKGKLFFDGYDSGSTVKQIRGDYDYEYTYTIEPEEVNRLYPLFGLEEGDKPALLQQIKNRFSGNKAYSLFGDFLKTNAIRFEQFTWG